MFICNTRTHCQHITISIVRYYVVSSRRVVLGVDVLTVFTLVYVFLFFFCVFFLFFLLFLLSCIPHRFLPLIWPRKLASLPSQIVAIHYPTLPRTFTGIYP